MSVDSDVSQKRSCTIPIGQPSPVCTYTGGGDPVWRPSDCLAVVYSMDDDHIAEYWQVAELREPANPEVFNSYLRRYVDEPESIAIWSWWAA